MLWSHCISLTMCSGSVLSLDTPTNKHKKFLHQCFYSFSLQCSIHLWPVGDICDLYPSLPSSLLYSCVFSTLCESIFTCACFRGKKKKLGLGCPKRDRADHMKMPKGRIFIYLLVIRVKNILIYNSSEPEVNMWNHLQASTSTATTVISKSHSNVMKDFVSCICARVIEFV